MDPVIIATARRHGVRDQDILHAYRYPVRVLALDELTMFEFIVHAMPARDRFLE